MMLGKIGIFKNSPIQTKSNNQNGTKAASNPFLANQQGDIAVFTSNKASNISFGVNLSKLKQAVLATQMERLTDGAFSLNTKAAVAQIMKALQDSKNKAGDIEVLANLFAADNLYAEFGKILAGAGSELAEKGSAIKARLQYLAKTGTSKVIDAFKGVQPNYIGKPNAKAFIMKFSEIDPNYAQEMRTGAHLYYDRGKPGSATMVTRKAFRATSDPILKTQLFEDFRFFAREDKKPPMLRFPKGLHQ